MKEANEMVETDSPLKKAQKKYQKKCKILTVRINRETDPDLIRWLEENEGKAGTKIKNLIRKDMRTE